MNKLLILITIVLISFVIYISLPNEERNICLVISDKEEGDIGLKVVLNTSGIDIERPLYYNIVMIDKYTEYFDVTLPVRTNGPLRSSAISYLLKQVDQKHYNLLIEGWVDIEGKRYIIDETIKLEYMTNSNGTKNDTSWTIKWIKL